MISPAVPGCPRTVEGRAAETRLEPEMHTGLIARLYGTDTAAGGRSNASDHRSLGRPRQILVKIDQIVIPDAGPAGAAGEDVPNRLVEAAGDKPPLRQSNSSDTPEKAHGGPDRRGRSPRNDATARVWSRGEGHVSRRPRGPKAILGDWAWTSRLACLRRALGLQSFPRASFTHVQHGAGIEAAITQCGQRFPRALDREGRRCSRLQPPLLVESENFGIARRNLRRAPLAIVADLQSAHLDV